MSVEISPGGNRLDATEVGARLRGLPRRCAVRGALLGTGLALLLQAAVFAAVELAYAGPRRPMGYSLFLWPLLHAPVAGLTWPGYAAAAHVGVPDGLAFGAWLVAMPLLQWGALGWIIGAVRRRRQRALLLPAERGEGDGGPGSIPTAT